MNLWRKRSFQGVLVVVTWMMVANAQTALTRYYGSELQAIPGDIFVGTDGLSTLDFYNVIEDVYLGNSSLFTVEVKDNRLILGTTLSKADTDLQVFVDGAILNFNLTIDNSFKQPRTYLIERERPRPSIEDPLNPRTLSEDLQADVTLTLFQATPISDGESTVFFTFTNTSTQVVALDSARLVVTQNDTTLIAKVTKHPLRQLIEPGETHSGLVIIQGVVPGTTHLKWTAVEMQGNGREVTFNESVQIPR